MAIDPELAAVVDLLPDMEALDLQARRDAITAMVDASSTRSRARSTARGW